MKVMHVLNSRIYSGAEKVVCQIIKSFRGEIEMVYCSPDSDIVRQMLAEQNVTYLPMKNMSVSELRRVIREQKPDLIHAHDMRAGFFSALCCGKIPLVSHIHNNAYDARGLSAKTVGYLLAGFKAKHILWVSQSSFDGYAFHKLFAKKSSVLYNIIDTQQIFDKKAQDSHTYDYDMIYVGRLTYQKDPQRLMRLCARLKQEKPDLNVAIVGTGELLEEAQTLCESLNIQENVHFLGFHQNGGGQQGHDSHLPLGGHSHVRAGSHGAGHARGQHSLRRHEGFAGGRRQRLSDRGRRADGTGFAENFR